jgi:23S rRNA pseudouridine2604 synthase
MSEQSVRLSKRMVELGLCSRREADEFIEQGLVRVDGEVIRVLGSRVEPEQKIELARPASPLTDARITLLLNRPSGIADAVPALIAAETLSPLDQSGIAFIARHRRNLTGFGAQDPASSGLQVLTQDKFLAQKLAECEQEYLVQVEAAPDAETLKQRFNEQSLKALAMAPGKVTRQGDRQLRFVLHSPLPGQIQRMCEHAGIQADSVRCIRIGRIALGKIAPGQWRYLLPMERF